MVRLAEPAWLFLLFLAPLPGLALRLRPRLAWPTLTGFARAPRAWAGPVRHLPALLRGLAIAGLAIALARPQTVAGRQHIAARGVAIVVALDRSTSMDAGDCPDASGARITRLEAARRTFARFVEGRPDDLIGLVAFANFPDLVCPPTLDHAFLLDVARALKSPAHPGEDGTNIGDAVAWSLDALRHTTPRKKVLVLLTDGENRPQGTVTRPLNPRAAARLAAELGVTLHTIALGRGGLVRQAIPGTDLGVSAEVEGPNLQLLADLADFGGGRMFTATDTVSLAAIFRAIDALEKSPVQGTIRTRYRDWYAPVLAVAVALLTLDRLLSGGRLRRLP